ncbi:MAG: amino acid ABC transporter permease [Clostridia bacterium]|nr:amino acid ABC transporter permease [Clostridia bacterium]
MAFSVMMTQLLIGFTMSLRIFALTLVGALPLGLLVYFGRVSRFKPIAFIVKAYISIMRGTPLILQVMVVYFGPNLIFGLSLPANWRFWAAVVAFIVNYAAYFGEIYRGGISSIPIGQYEAGPVLGYTKAQTFIKIILPQMVRNVLPPVTNEVVTLVRDTSIAYAIGTVEMFTKARQIAVAPNSPGMITFLMAAVVYYVFNFFVAYLMGRIEKKLDYY